MSLPEAHGAPAFGHDPAVADTDPVSRRALLRGLVPAGLMARVEVAAERSPVAPTAPTGRLTTAWEADPWSLGAYSAIPPGRTGGSRRVLARTRIADRIVLAGEHTDTRFPATVHGALRSGRRAARLLGRVGGRRAIVIGAGVAGLAAARELADRGATPIVVEARDRIGGRILTDRSWGVPVELGAAWVHGLRGNPLVPLAGQAGLRLVPCDYEDATARSCATGLPLPPALDAAERLEALLLELGEGSPPPDQALSVGGWLRTRGWRGTGVRGWAEATMIEQEWALGVERLGVRAVTEGATPRGGDALVAGGFDRIPALLAEGLDVRLGAPVARVAAAERGVEVHLEDGAALTADLAVVAVPLALLQRRRPLVEGLPDAAAEALRGLTTGVLEKAILRYDERWWPGRRRVYGAVPDADGPAGRRWTAFYDLTDVAGTPSLVALAGGVAATTRPAGEAAADEAAERLRRAYG